VPDGTACNSDGFLSRDRCITSTYVNMPIGGKK
jgi:hypothetical protein